MKSLLVSAIALLGMSGPLLAGTLAPAPADPVIPVPVVEEWTGPYAGIELGFGDATASARNGRFNGNGMLYGATLGYDRDMGGWVLGVALDFDLTDIAVGGVNVDSVARLKMRVGADLGNSLAYAVAGAARADTNLIGSDTGWAAGLGFEHRLSQHWSLGGEALYHEFRNFNGTGLNIEATTFALRALYRF